VFFLCLAYTSALKMERIHTILLDYGVIFRELIFFIITAVTSSNLTRSIVLRLKIRDFAKVEENSNR
jgi:hypothetical protein